MLDLQSRLNVNEGFLNSYNLFWTNLTYLYPFVFLCIVICCVQFLLFHCIWEASCLIIIFLIYNTELLSFLVINSGSYCLVFINSSINLLLSNNLNKYHPFIFYFSVFLTCYLTLFTSTLNECKLLFQQISSNLYIKRTIQQIFKTNTFALFLGSWWALQEGTWGGWWNWDASEVLGLLIGLNAVLSFHSYQWYVNMTQINERLKLNFLLITLFFYFIQLNFDLVSHNFGASLFMFFSSNFFFLEATYVTLVLLLSLYLKTYTFRNITLVLTSFCSKYNKIVYNSVIYPLFVIKITITIILLSSFLPLLNYFFWNYFAINSFNINININYLIIGLLLSISVLYHDIRYLNIPIILTITTVWFQSLINVIPLLIFTKFKLNYINHYAIITLIAVNILSYSLNFTYFKHSSIWEDLYDGDFVKSPLNTSYICSNYFIEKLDVMVSMQGYKINWWNTLYFTNITTSNSLGLSLDICKLTTWLILPSEWNCLLLINGNSFLLTELNLLIIFSILTGLKVVKRDVFNLRTY